MINKMNISKRVSLKKQKPMPGVMSVSLRAQVTVMAAMVFMLVVSFVTTCVNSAAMSGCNTVIKQACSLSDESVFAAYSNDVLKQFDIFTLKKSDIINGKIPQYINTNIKTYSKEISLTEAAYTDYKYMTDNGGYGVEEQIIKYMKSGGYADIVKDYNTVNDSIKESDAVSRVAEAICSTQDTAYKSWSSMNTLINACCDMDDKENEISDVVSFCKQVTDSKDYSCGADDIDLLFKYGKKLEKISYEIQSISEDILNQASLYEELKSQEEQSKRECYEKLDSNRPNISDTLYQQLSEDIDRMYTEYGDIQELSREYIKEIVDNDNAVIDKIIGDMHAIGDICVEISELDIYEDEEFKIIENYGDSNNDDNDGMKRDNVIIKKQEYIAKIEEMYQNIESEINGLCIKTIVHEYKQYTSANDYNNSTASLNKIYQILKEGVAGFVIDGDISDKVIDYKDLADTCVSGGYGGDGISNMDIRQALVGEYIISRYSGYTDYIDKNGHETSRMEHIEKESRTDERLLDYEIEYILCGKQSDRDNLNEVLIKLSLIREGLNLSYLVTDGQKKNECLALSVQLLGYTGNMALIKAAQYFIMSIWAYAESIIELRNLYAGGSIATLKNADNWMTDIKGIISGDVSSLKTNMSADESKAGHKTGDTDEYNSLDYMDYMRILLLMKDRTAKNAGIMSAMELVMIALGHKDFRMKEYIYEASGMAVFAYVKNGHTYRQKLGYSYV